MYIMKLHYFSSELKKATSFRNALENNILCVGSFLVPHTHSLGLAGKGNPVHFLASFSHLFKKQVFSSELDPTCNSKPPKPGLTKEYAHWTLIFWSTLMIDQCRENSIISRALTRFSFQVNGVGVQRRLCFYSSARFEEKYEHSKWNLSSDFWKNVFPSPPSRRTRCASSQSTRTATCPGWSRSKFLPLKSRRQTYLREIRKLFFLALH